MTIGENIKHYRELKGMTQAELARVVITTSQNISQYERGIRTPKLETVKKIADALEIDWLDLYPLYTVASSNGNHMGLGDDVEVADIVTIQKRGIKEEYEKLNTDAQVKAGYLFIENLSPYTMDDVIDGINQLKKIPQNQRLPDSIKEKHHGENT